MDDHPKTAEQSSMDVPSSMENRPIRVLLVEDDEDDFILTRDLLQEIPGTRFQLDWISTYALALASMLKNDHDVYLLDYRLSGHNGVELLREARQVGCRGPIIFLTGQGGQTLDLEAMRAGASEFLVKGDINA